MKNEEIVALGVIVEDMLNNLFNSDLLKDEDDTIKEERCIEEIIKILQDRISYY
jgi:hypothetical protein